LTENGMHLAKYGKSWAARDGFEAKPQGFSPNMDKSDIKSPRGFRPMSKRHQCAR